MELPQHLINEVQKYTNAPWWNGQAYAECKGFPQAVRAYKNGVGDAIDDLSDVIDWLRSEKQFDKADRLRTIAGRLARLRPADENKETLGLVRSVARGWK